MGTDAGAVDSAVTKAKAERHSWPDYAKGLSIILVAYSHCTLFYARPDPSALTSATSYLQFARMPLFFFVSGLFLHRVLDAPRSKLIARLTNLAYLYVLWSFIRIAFLAVTAIASGEPVQLDLLQNLLIRPGNGLWFLYALAVFTGLIGLLRRIPPTLLTLFGAIVAVVIAGLEEQHLGTGVKVLDRMLPLFVFFSLGHAISSNALAWGARVDFMSTVALGVLFATLCAALSLQQIAPLEGFIVAVQLAGVAFLCGVCALLAARGWIPILRRVGGLSLPVYVLHFYVIAVAARLPRLPVPAELQNLLLTLASVVIALTIYSLANRAHLKFLFAVPHFLLAKTDRRIDKTTDSVVPRGQAAQ